jgi:hypothetical protein
LVDDTRLSSTARPPAKNMVKKKDSEEVEEAQNGVIVGDPEILRPRELPLVVKPEGGKWKNEAQEKFAKTLNAYAYKNTVKWEKKKLVLIKQLVELGDDPSKLAVLTGTVDEVGGRVTFKNKLIEQ